MARNIEELINRQIHRWNSMSNILRRQANLVEDEFERTAETPRAVHPVICISREMGSGARDIARLLCKRLNYELFGSEIINEIARDLKVQERLIESLDEHDRGELQIMIDSFLSGHEIEKSDFLNSLTKIVQTLALKGGVVLLGRGGSYILKNLSALNVRVIAPLPERIERVQLYLGIDEAKARKLVENCDYARARFVRQFFHEDINEQHHYDLVLNTSRIPTIAAVELIMAALRVRGFIPERLAIPERVDV
ncbi:cytidylate kinase-like family protein [bacterium]|nr:cytidylate kinase-like family protein [bacterium]